MDHLKNEKSSPLYQLQKYYPRIFASLKQKQFNLMQDCVRENLERGIKQDLFRKELNIDFISRIYFSSIIAIKDQDLFPYKQFSMNMLMENYLEYHIRGICTSKGLDYLQQFTNSYQL